MASDAGDKNCSLLAQMLLRLHATRPAGGGPAGYALPQGWACPTGCLCKRAPRRMRVLREANNGPVAVSPSPITKSRPPAPRAVQRKCEQPALLRTSPKNGTAVVLEEQAGT